MLTQYDAYIRLTNTPPTSLNDIKAETNGWKKVGLFTVGKFTIDKDNEEITGRSVPHVFTEKVEFEIEALAINENKVVNGKFGGTGSPWNRGTGWTIDSATKKAVCSSPTTGSQLSQDTIFITGNKYQVKFDAVITAGSMKLFSNTQDVQTITTTGAYTIEFDCTSSGKIAFQAVATSFAGSIDNVVVTHMQVMNFNNVACDICLRSTQIGSISPLIMNTKTAVKIIFDAIEHSKVSLTGKAIAEDISDFVKFFTATS